MNDQAKLISNLKKENYYMNVMPFKIILKAICVPLEWKILK